MSEKKSIESDHTQTNAYVYDVDTNEEVDAFEQMKGTEGYVEYRTLNWFQGGGLLLAETLALGVLSFPNVMANIGLWPAIFTTIVLAVLAWITGIMLVDFKLNHPSVMNFADAGYIVGGKFFKWVLFGAIVLKSVLIQASHVNSGGGAFTAMSRNAVCSVLLCFFMALLGFVFTIPRKFSEVSWASFASCISIVSACLITIIGVGAVDRDQWRDANGDIPWRAQRDSGLVDTINSLTNIIFAYGGHAAIFAFLGEMKKPKDFKKSLAMVQVISTLFYILVGVSVYLIVGENNVKSPALSISTYTVETVAYAIALVSITISGAIPATNGAKQIWVEAFKGKKMLTSSDWKSYGLWIALVFTTWMIGFVIAQLIPFFSSLLSIISSILTCWLTYGISGILFLYDNRKQYKKKIWMTAFSVFIILFSSVITPLGMYTAITAIKEGYENGSYDHPFACKSS
ncbi:hypothetical protein E3P99_00402 [Wallemia hederae]|uniref:Amino acid transporter transmembrane domain-containing protein n=1 Tax=Wallemia hederae TaxID=1540922 RepID=A0A4T0FVJ6_9BASI|nr:hypothetical protein E3P99_00402 [Wallemia hederae]